MITSYKRDPKGIILSNQVHEIISDVNQVSGGEDAGLNPHELLEASLAACTWLTLDLYARRKKWDTSGLLVEVKITKEGAESVFERKITFGPQTSLEEKERLFEIAEKCPIHKLLSSQVHIQTMTP